MKVRGLVALALILAATGLERMAYYGSRSFLSLDLHQQGATSASVGTTMAALQGVSILGTLLGGVAALGIGPRATAAAAVLIAAIGHFALAAGAPIIVGAGVVALGAGLFRPCPYVAAAEVLAWDEESPAAPGPHRFSAVAAFTVLTYGAINVGAFLGPLVAGTLRQSSSALAYAVNGAVGVLATMFAGSAAVLGFLGGGARAVPAQGPYRMGEPTPAPAPMPAPVGLAIAGVAILLVPQVVLQIGISLSEPPFGLVSGASEMWLYALNPLVVVMASMGIFGVLLAAALQRWTLPPILLYGAGLVLFALGLVPIAAAGSGSLALYAIGTVIAAAGEAAAGGVVLAYVATAVRGRAATLVVAVWSAASLIMGSVGSALGGLESLRTPLLVVSALMCLGGGVAILALGRRLHTTFFDPAPPAVAA